MDTNEKNRETRQRRPQQGSAQRPSGTVKRSSAPQGGQRKVAQTKQVRRKTTSTNRSKREAAARAARIKAMKQATAQKTVQKPTRRKVSKPRRPMQPVVYTEPKAFNRSRLVVQLITVMAVVMALILGLSIFFKVETITVSGAEVYSAWTIREASGIEEGDNLLTFSRARASARIAAELPYVKSVRIGIKLPDTVNIEIEEIAVVYAIQCQDGIWWLMTSDGQVMEQSSAADAANYTKVLGVTLNSPIPGEQAYAYETVQASSEDSTEGTEVVQIPVTVTGQQRLSAAMQILQALELNDIVGKVASVDVENLERIELWYGTRYEVNLGGTNDLSYKIASMNYTIAALSDYETGQLDVSFTTWTDKVGYTPFE